MTRYQKLTGTAQKLNEYLQGIPVIDTHEHIARSEADYNAATIRFGDLFIPYVTNDLASAGMPFPKEGWNAIHCIDEDWDAFAPYWKHVRHGSYARPIRLALQEFYGVDDLTKENYQDILKQINDNNKPGIFKKIMADKCNIESSIRCAGDLPDADDPILKGNVSTTSVMSYTSNDIQTIANVTDRESITTLDELLEASDYWMEKQAKNGAIQFKSTAMPTVPLDKAKAEEGLARLLKEGTLDNWEGAPLRVFLRERNAKKAAELDLPLALHTGVWNDFRTIDVRDVVGLAERNPDTRFDVYHLGIPNVREAVQLVKNYPNCWLNLCWAHIVAPEMVVQTMKEALDMVPMNKVFAFGADYAMFIEKIWGHLVIARENLSLAFADRVDRGLMDLDDAKEILHGWFYDYPKEFYRI